MNKALQYAVFGVCLLGGCASKPVAEVSKNEMETVRKAHASATAGQPKQQVLARFDAGNKVKLGSSMVGDVAVEEWKVEAFHDENHRKDLFVRFLYFCDDRFVDSSDNRIDFRANPKLVEQWMSSTQ